MLWFFFIFYGFLQKVLVQCQREIFHRPFGTVIMCRRYQRTHRWVLLTFKYSWICKKCCIFIGHRSLICIQQMAATQQIHGFRMPQLPIMAVMRMRPTLLMLTTITWHNMEVYCDYHNSTDIVRGNFFISCEFCGWQQQKIKCNFLCVTVSRIDYITTNKVLLMPLKRVLLRTLAIQVWQVRHVITIFLNEQTLVTNQSKVKAQKWFDNGLTFWSAQIKRKIIWTFQTTSSPQIPV